MSWDRKRIPMYSPHFLLGKMVVKRRSPCIAELQVLLRRKQGVHQLDGMRRKHIRFVPRKSFLVSEGCGMIEDFISYPQQSLRPHDGIKKGRYVQCDLFLERTWTWAWTIPSYPATQLAAIWLRESQPT